jgi:hypothetical protein
MDNIIANLNPQEHLKPELKSVLEHMQVLAGENKLLAIDPLDKQRL